MADTAIASLRQILNGFRALNSKGIYSMNATETDLLRQILTEVQALSLGATVADGSITAVKLASDAVTTAKILDANVTTSKLASDAVTTAKILDANVTTSKLASDAVTTAKILDANVTTAKIADANVTPVKLSQPFTRGTAVATTSGTAIDFTGIPDWVKRITVMFNGVSTNGSSPPQIQLGGSGGIETTGYASSNTAVAGGTAQALFTTGFGVGVNTANWGGVVVVSGAITITLLNSSTNTWVASGSVGRTDSASSHFTQGGKSLSATLNRVRITTVNGTDTFDAGSINILYE